ncbi:hypothetical protein [Inconstantimicrobium mannanitabidum]|uniref:Uncharacterized protein n=1 Tax=Inconstantimicrobium mannanitabidum TaxID=1604901 RepID=A0ACB5RGW5_9CLOT|nr:hypothetical protein [Clostridium sp. TW13]GKX68316.1 hypothetical protein rsdtw13_35740 [Clostridium sp. TW13]
MDNIVRTVKFDSYGHLEYSSSAQKTAISKFKGRSASFFRISAGYCVNP